MEIFIGLIDWREKWWHNINSVNRSSMMYLMGISALLGSGAILLESCESERFALFIGIVLGHEDVILSVLHDPGDRVSGRVVRFGTPEGILTFDLYYMAVAWEQTSMEDCAYWQWFEERFRAVLIAGAADGRTALAVARWITDSFRLGPLEGRR